MSQVKTIARRGGRELREIPSAGLFILYKDGKAVQRTRDANIGNEWCTAVRNDFAIVVQRSDQRTWN